MNRPLYMHHELKQIPNYLLPKGYHFRQFTREDDPETWARVTTNAGEFPSKEKALERFNIEFSPYLGEATKRIIFIETSEGQTIGTATAWFGKWGGREIGRLHWVDIKPEFQEKKLGRPLITKAMTLLQKHHTFAYLKTQATSPAAIHLYKQLGWFPYSETNAERMLWKDFK